MPFEMSDPRAAGDPRTDTEVEGVVESQVETTPEPDGPLDDFSDKLAAFHRLTSKDPEAADEFLLALGGDFAEAETNIVEQMSDRRVLAQPGRFIAANRNVVKAVEVLYRNGRVAAPIKGWGFLRPVVQLLQVFITSYVTRSHVRRLLQGTLELYLARENQATRGGEEWHLLFYARRNLDRLDGRYRGDRFGVPTFIAGGAVFAAIFSGLGSLAESVLKRDLLLLVFSGLMLALLLAVGSGIVQAAGVAKRRIAMTTQRPMKTLHEVVGAAGQPPRDFAWLFGLGAVAILLVVWIIIPGAILGVFFN